MVQNEIKLLVPESYDYDELKDLVAGESVTMEQKDAVEYFKEQLGNDCFRAYIEHADHTVDMLYNDEYNRIIEEEKSNYEQSRRQHVEDNMNSYLTDMKVGEKFCLTFSDHLAHYIAYKKEENFIVAKYDTDELYMSARRAIIHLQFHIEDVTLQKASDYIKQDINHCAFYNIWMDTLSLKPKCLGSYINEDKQQINAEKNLINTDPMAYLVMLPNHSELRFTNFENEELPQGTNVHIITKINNDTYRSEYFERNQ